MVAELATRTVPDTSELGIVTEAPHLDSGPPQQIHILGHQLRVSGGFEQVANDAGAAVRNCLTQILVVVRQQPMPLPGRGLCRRPGRGVVLIERVAEPPHRLVGALERQTPGGALLVEHPHRTLVAAKGGGVAGIEEVEPLAGHVLDSGPVEGLGIGPAKADKPLLGKAGEERAVGVGRWIEVELHIRTHLVQIDNDLRSPLQPRRHPGPGLTLGLRPPVPVGVEEVVTGAKLGRFPAVEVVRPIVALGLGSRPSTDALQIAPGKGVAAIGIEHRIEENHRVVENLEGLGILGCRQPLQSLRTPSAPDSSKPWIEPPM